jgi:polyisoprenoid-binding protein YceI
MKKYFAVILFLSVKSISFAQAKHTVTNSSVKFEIKNMGINTGGSFSGLKADIKFDPAHLDASIIEASIDTKTINTENESRDHHLKSDSYFDVEKYPAIGMKSVSFKHKSGDNYTGVFNLTIKDKTNPVEVPFTYSENGNTASFKGSFKIKRTDYGVGGKSLVMSNDVTVTIVVDTSKINLDTSK